MGLIRYAFSGDEIVPAGAAPTELDDGDFWGGVARCGVAVAVAASLVPARPAFADDSDFVAPAAPTQVVDEDYRPVNVQPLTPWLRLYLPDPEELPVSTVVEQPDEDLYLPPAPTAPTLYQRLPLGDTEEIPAGSLFGVPEEDAWAPLRVVAPQAVPPRIFADDSDAVFTVAAALAPDEDFWTPPPQPWPALGKLYLPDPEELAVTAAAPQPVPDEDAWAPSPPRATPWAPRIFADDSDAVSPVATLAAEEDAWQPRATTLWPSPRLYLPDAEDAPAGFLRGMPDEDFWSLAPRTVAAVWYFRPPTSFDSDGMPPQPAPLFGRTIAGILGQQDAYSLLGRQDAPAILGQLDAYALLGRVDLYGLLGRQDAYSIPGANMPLSALVTVPLGDDVVVPMTLQNADTTAFNLTGCTIVVGVKKVLTDTTATISKTIANGGIVVTNAAGGLANLILNAADTAALGAGQYPFDVQVTNASAKKATLIIGTLTLTDHPTR